MTQTKDKVLLGQITGAHGVKGLIKVQSYTEDPATILSYGTLYDEAGEPCFDLALAHQNKDMLICALTGITDRTAAEKLRGKKLYTLRENLPTLAENTFYHTDLIGMTVKNKQGKLEGIVSAIFNFGAGDILEVTTLEARKVMLPFSSLVISSLSLKTKEIIITDDFWFSTDLDAKPEKPEKPSKPTKTKGKAKGESDV